MLGLEDLLDRRPAALSGGQRQRVAMGRAIVREPKAFLMDEPLSNLDAKLRVSMRAQLSSLHSRLGTTTIYVTHDQVEAMTLGQRVAVMRDGRILQVDTPQLLYANPLNLFVAAFIGSPAMNLVEASISDGTVEFAGFRIPLAPQNRPAMSSSRVVVGIRPGGVRGRGVRRRGAAAARGDGRRRRGARRGHARDLPDRRAAGRRRRRARGRRRRRRAHARRPRALHRADRPARARRAPGGRCGSPSTRPASTSSTRTAGCACRPPAPRSRRPLPRRAAAVLALALAAACASAASRRRPAVSLARLAGETVMSPLTGPPGPTFLARVRAGELGGVILVGHWRSAAVMAATTRTLQAAACTAGEPLLIGVDQEGGVVRRLPWAAPFETPAALGRVDDAERGRAGRRGSGRGAAGRGRRRRLRAGRGHAAVAAELPRQPLVRQRPRGRRQPRGRVRPGACRRPASPRPRSTSPVSARRR